MTANRPVTGPGVDGSSDPKEMNAHPDPPFTHKMTDRETAGWVCTLPCEGPVRGKPAWSALHLPPQGPAEAGAGTGESLCSRLLVGSTLWGLV